MSEARVENIDAIKAFKVALWKFAESANVALSEAEADAMATLRWLDVEQRTYWQNAVRKSQENVVRCAEAVRHKKIFKDSSGRMPSAVDEEKALVKAKRMLEHAEERLENVRKYTPRLQREILLYKGQAQRLATFVGAEIPAAAAKLDKMVAMLDAYVNLSASTSQASTMSQPPPAAEQTPDDALPMKAPTKAQADAPTNAPIDAPTAAPIDAPTAPGPKHEEPA